jgi:hypothetical protein
MAEFDTHGRQIPDSRPVEVPMNMRPPSQEELIARAVSEELSRRAEKAEAETLEDSLDFGDLDEDEVLTSPYEINEMQEEYLLDDLNGSQNPQENEDPSPQRDPAVSQQADPEEPEREHNAEHSPPQAASG